MKLIKLCLLIFTILMFVSIYQGIKSDIEAVQSLEEYCESCRENKPGGNLSGGAG